MILTLEQNIKLLIKSQLQAILGAKFELLISNDINYKSMNKITEIIGVIKTGQGTQSGVKDILSTNVVSTLTFKCASNYLQEILSLFNQYVQQVNGIYYSILSNEDEDILIIPIDQAYDTTIWNPTGEVFKLGLTTPTVIGSPQRDIVNNESINTSVFILTGNIYYSNLPIPRNKYMQFGEEKILIDGIQSFSDNETFNYQASANNSDLGLSTFTDRQRTINFAIWRKNNPFCNKIETEILSNKTFKFFIGDTSVDVVFLNKTLQENNGIESYSIVLKVVNDGKG